MNLNLFQELIEQEFQKLIRPLNANNHIFLNDMSDVNKFENIVKKNYFIPIYNKLHKKNLTVKYENKIVNKQNILCDSPINKVAPHTLLDRIIKLINSTTSLTNIYRAVYKLDKYLLPSTINNLDKYLNKIKDGTTNIYKDNRINILIIGAGPAGLFMANYLDNYYYSKNKVRILVIDNRIQKESYRYPYSRTRFFNFATNDVLTILPFIKCWKKSWNAIPIKVLENLLYLQAYDSQIPIYFTKKYQNIEDIIKLSKKYKFNIILDATGNRLNYQYKPKKNWLSGLQMKNSKYDIIINNNEVELKWKNDIKYKIVR